MRWWQHKELLATTGHLWKGIWTSSKGAFLYISHLVPPTLDPQITKTWTAVLWPFWAPQVHPQPNLEIPFCFSSLKLKSRIWYATYVSNPIFWQPPFRNSLDLWPSASFTAVCRFPCQNGGICQRPNACSCPDGWMGRLCEERESFFKPYFESW